MKWLPFAAAVVLIVTAGCSRPDDEVVRILHPQIHWDYVSTVRVGLVDDAFTNLVPDGTDGVFPASIAVARVTVDGDDLDDDQPRVVMNMEPANDFLSWNGLFDNLRYISEVFPLHGHDLGEDQPSPEQIVSAAAHLTAGLCLVYGRSDPSATESEVRGVIYRTDTGEPLAAIRANVSAPHPETIERPPDQVKGDNRHYDPRHLADLRFERLVLDCVRDLRRGDRPVIIQPPEGWTPAEPFERRDWPPPPFGTPQGH